MLPLHDFVLSFVKLKHADRLSNWLNDVGKWEDTWVVKKRSRVRSQNCGNDSHLVAPHIYMQRKLWHAKESKRNFILGNCFQACPVWQNFAGNFKHIRQKAIVTQTIKNIDSAPVANEWGGESDVAKHFVQFVDLCSLTKNLIWNWTELLCF